MSVQDQDYINNLNHMIYLRDEKLKKINDLMEKADSCDCNWEPLCDECLEAWCKAKDLSS